MSCEMPCRACGGKLVEENGRFVCEHCKQAFDDADDAVGDPWDDADEGMTREQRDEVDEIAAQSIGTATHDPWDSVEELTANWSDQAKREAVDRLNEQVFYCDGCGWYCDIDECHSGDLCDDCHDEREDEDEE